MNKRLGEIIKMDVALEPQTIVSGGAQTSSYFDMGKARRASFVVVAEQEGENEADVLLAGETAVITVREGTDTTPTTSQILEDRAGDNIVVTVTGAVNAARAIIDITANRDDDDEVIVNGVSFTRDAAGYDVDDRPLNFNSRDDLVNAINNHFDDIEADDGAANEVVVYPVQPGEQTVTIVDNIDHGDSWCGSIRFIAHVDVDAEEMSTGHTSLGVNVANGSTDGDADYTVTLLRGDQRHSPRQTVAGSR